MSKRSWAPGLIIMILVAACGGSPRPAPTPPAKPAPIEAAGPVASSADLEAPPPPLPPIPSTPAPAPDGLMATVAIRDPGGLIAALASYVRRIDADAAAALTLPTMAGLLSEHHGIDLGGADLGHGVRALLLDPARIPMPLIVVVRVADRQRLEATAARRGLRVQVHGDHAAIGSHDALVVGGAHALTALVAAPLPVAPTIELDMRYVMSQYRSVIEGVLAGAGPVGPPAQVMMQTRIMAGMTSFLTQLDRLAIAFEVEPARASVIMRLDPRAGTALADLASRQVPASFALLDRVPAGGMVSAGRLDLGELTTGLAEMIEPMMRPTYGEAAPAIAAAMRKWAALKTGEHAMGFVMAATGFGGGAVWEMDDPAAMMAIWAEQFAAMGKAKGGHYDVSTSRATHRGTKVLISTARPSKHMPPEVRAVHARMGPVGYAIAQVRGGVVFGLGPAALVDVKAMIDRARAGGGGKVPGAVSERLATVVADARRRRESYLLTMDLPALVAGAAALGGAPVVARPPSPGLEPTVTALGADGGAFTVRVTVPSAQIADTAATMRAGESQGAEVAIAEMQRLGDKLCACADMKCAGEVLKEMASMKEPASKPTVEQINRAMAIAGRMADCQKRLIEKSAPPKAP